jgi:retron-type reverse transcriptase
MEKGTPQGGSASPLLANIYLHYAFDLWAQAWRRKQAHGDVIVVRYADDIVVGFQSEMDAKQFLAELTERFRKFSLELHPDKNAASGVRTVRGPKPGTAQRREAGNVRLPWLHAYLREDEKQRLLHGAAADDS